MLPPVTGPWTLSNAAERDVAAGPTLACGGNA